MFAPLKDMEPKSYHHSQLSPAHEAILDMLRPGMLVLEVGCATGYMSRVMKERLGCRVVAIEIDPQQAVQAEPYSERMIVGDVTNVDVRKLVTEKFDAVICADVLEHLPDPWETLRWLRENIADGGVLLASIPNVAYREVRKQLLLGKFDYCQFGILDDSHLRFFTEKTVRELFASTGYTLRELARMYRGRIDRMLKSLSPNAFTYQFVIKAVPNKPAGTEGTL